MRNKVHEKIDLAAAGSVDKRITSDRLEFRVSFHQINYFVAFSLASSADCFSAIVTCLF